MSSFTTVRGFVTIILSISVTHGETSWGVNYSSGHVCALKGSTVNISSTFKYPQTLNYTLEQMFWFVKLENGNPVDLRMDSHYAGRVRYHCGGKKCILTITNVRESDSGVYKFRFITNQPGGSYTGQQGVNLSVTGVEVKLTKISSCKIWSCIWSNLACRSSCLPLHSSYIWYQNGKIIDKKDTYSQYFYSAVSLSCALTGYEDSPSPIVCVSSGSCTAVSYAERHICAFKGSSVNISCTYTSKDVHDEQKFWVRQQETTTQPAKLQRDPRFVEFTQKKGHYTLTIFDLIKSDSGVYRFKFGGKSDEWTSSLPGTTLTVTDPDIEVQVIWSPSGPKLICHSSCLNPGPSSFLWFKNEERIHNETLFLYGGVVDVSDKHSCVYEGHRSPSVYAPTIPQVLMNHSGDVLKNSSISLKCTSDANPPASYSWYSVNRAPVNKKKLVFKSIQPSDSGDYHCVAENGLGRTVSRSVFIDVKYGPSHSSVSVSPPGEIVEGNSVTLTCSSDANPPATFSWYKENQTLPGQQKDHLHFTSITFKDRGNYYCRSENRYGWTNSTLVHLDVQYAPKLPLMSVSPSGGITEGMSVTLTCSSDANPAANYTWYKEEEEAWRAYGQVVIINDFKPAHIGKYCCEAKNTRGLHKSTSFVITTGGSRRSAAIGVLIIIVLTLAILAVYLHKRRSKRLKRQSQNGVTSRNSESTNMSPVNNTPTHSAEGQSTEPQEHHDYSTLSSFQRQTEPLYSNIGSIATQTEEATVEDDMNYSVITFDSMARARYEENGNESMVVYSTINKMK